MAAKSSLVTINFARDAPGYDKASVYRGKNLYARGNQYSEDFWKKGGSTIMTPEEEEIVKSIRTEAAAQEPKP